MTKKASVYCEPFRIEAGLQVEIHRDSYEANDPNYSCFMHFHQVHEIILFERVEGLFYYHKGESELRHNDIVFTPALETHDFELNNAKKSWFIIQFSTNFLEAEDLKNLAHYFQAGMHLRLPEVKLAQFKQAVGWLMQNYSENPHSEVNANLVKLLIVILHEHATPLKPIYEQSTSTSTTFKKIQPIVELFRFQPSVNLTLEQAANLCHLSPSYFSRVFKRVFRYSFTEYSVRHRLYSAARLLSQNSLSIADISVRLHFSSPSYFINLFKKQFGCTPKKYQQSLLQRTEPSVLKSK